MFIKSMPKNIYIHLPFCLKKCSFCAFPVHPLGKNYQTHNQLMDKYLKYLTKQIQTSVILNSKTQNIQTIYFGGGTPSLFEAQKIKQILNLLQKKLLKKINQTEITIQMNIQNLQKVREFQKIGINRFSVGIQTFDSQKLKNLNRFNIYDQDSSIFAKTVQQIKKYRPKNLNTDFILDFNSKPQQIAMISDFIQQIQPEHITMYLLQIIENTYLHKNLRDKRFQEIISLNSNVHQIYSSFSQILTNKYGYQHYQISNFAKIKQSSNKSHKKSQFRSKHNQNYWKGNSPFAGFGMGACSLINKMRITRPKSLKKYFQFVQTLQKVSKEQKKIEELQKYLEIHDQRTQLREIQQLITSSIRRKQGIVFSQFDQILKDENLKKQVIECLKKEIIQINQQRQKLININNFDKQINLQIPQGFLMADEIGWRLILKIQQLFKNKDIQNKILLI